MLGRALKTVAELKPRSVCVVVGNKAEKVREYVAANYPRTKFAVQKVLDGSAGAVRIARSWLKKQRGVVLVTCGDMPLLKADSLKELIASHVKSENEVTVLTAEVENPFGYGRIVRSFDGGVEKIVEELDASPEEKSLKETNTGTYCFSAKALLDVIGRVKNNNAKKEFYLTDALELIRNDGGRVGASPCTEANEASGINNRADLSKAEGLLRERKLRELMAGGITILDPPTTYVDETVSVGPDTVIWPQTFLLGNTKIGSRCRIGPWAFVKDCQIENDVILQASFAESSVIKSRSKIGPFSRIRPGCILGPKVHLGNFSELKNAKLGEGSKANHLSYLGDAKIGKNVNIGAGTITCNYDGIRKHPTIIQDNAFIGSNVNLIAPIRVGSHAIVGAGSSLSENVPPWALALERSPRIDKRNWVKKFRREAGKK